VDNGSTDGTPDAVRTAHPSVDVVVLDANLGAAARNRGVARASTPYVAFSDDDSWWDPGALTIAAATLDAHPSVALVAARIIVEPSGRVDATCTRMAASPLGRDERLPGPSVLGFVACGAIVRRSAFVAAGGFPDGYGIGGEEAPLALALAANGWDLVYVDDVRAHHRPSPNREPTARIRREARNDVWTAWLRLSPPGALLATFRAANQARTNPAARFGVIDALRSLPAMWPQRRVVPRAVANDWHTVQTSSIRVAHGANGGITQTIRDPGGQDADCSRHDEPNR
jgi:GT2 family glycosyltransferase